MNLFNKLKNLLQVILIFFKKRYLNLKQISLAQITKSEDIKIISTVDFRGGLTLEELCVIISITKYYKVKNYLEIGSFRGRTSINIAHNNTNINIDTLDLPNDYKFDNLQFKLLKNDTIQASHQKRGYFFEKYKEYSNKINNYYGDSANFDFKKLDKKFDLIFIDGSHKYENVVIDSINAINILYEHGFIIWHDYSIQNMEVVKAIKYIKKKYNLKIYSIKNTKFAIYGKNLKI